MEISQNNEYGLRSTKPFKDVQDLGGWRVDCGILGEREGEEMGGGEEGRGAGGGDGRGEEGGEGGGEGEGEGEGEEGGGRTEGEECGTTNFVRLY